VVSLSGHLRGSGGLRASPECNDMTTGAPNVGLFPR
jgi:hypothetical protein